MQVACGTNSVHNSVQFIIEVTRSEPLACVAVGVARDRRETVDDYVRLQDHYHWTTDCRASLNLHVFLAADGIHRKVQQH